MALGIHDIAEDVHTALGLQDLHQGLLQRLLHRRGYRWEEGDGKRICHTWGILPSSKHTGCHMDTYW